MCDPVTAAVTMAVVTVAGTTAQVIQAGKTAKAQAKAINEQHAVVLDENRQQASGEMFDRARAARREQARIRTAAGEAGLSLASGGVEALLMDSAMQTELSNDRSMANLESRNRAADAEATQMMSRVQKPTALGAGLQIAGAAAEGWGGIQSAKINVKRASGAA